jgi:hypothetical protein
MAQFHNTTTLNTTLELRKLPYLFRFLMLLPSSAVSPRSFF